MSFSLRPFSALLLALILTVSLAACSSTSTSSGATRATRSTDASTPAQQPADDGEEAVGAAADGMAEPSDAQAPGDSTISARQLDADSGEATTDAVPETGSVDEIVVFPEQRYEIDVEETTASDSEADAEIDRLRRELAATESELDRMRDEQVEPGYDSGQAGTASGAESDGASTDDGAQDYDADQSGASDSSGDDMATTGGADAARPGDASLAGNDEMDLSGKPAEFSIYFGYDQSGFESRFEPVIVAHAKFLKANPGLRVEIQGNCDERGSREYNIALGQRRAEAVKRALELLGIDGRRIGTVSFGAEKPVAFGQDEESYRLNRRADIVY